MWKPSLSGNIKIVKGVSRNGILQSKVIIDLRLIDSNGIILILIEVIMSFLSPLWGSPDGPLFGRVNVIGFWPYYGTLLC